MIGNNMLSSSTAEREVRALRALRGLSIGDAFGELFFTRLSITEQLNTRQVEYPAPWRYTDDTMMALSVYEVLCKYGTVDQDALALSFARHYDNTRGYGPAMHGVLARVGAGEPWTEVAGSLFNGHGSFGNGSAMRVAPIGAYFADDLPRVALETERAAVVTHAHPEAVAGAIAVAVGTAMALQHPELDRNAFLDAVIPYMQESVVLDGIRSARKLHPDTTPPQAARILGSGQQVSCQDTVPFTLWCAGSHLNDYAEALWATVSGLGDRDTTCAIVGGIVIGSAPDTVPQSWSDAAETLPSWVL